MNPFLLGKPWSFLLRPAMAQMKPAIHTESSVIFKVYQFRCWSHLGSVLIIRIRFVLHQPTGCSDLSHGHGIGHPRPRLELQLSKCMLGECCQPSASSSIIWSPHQKREKRYSIWASQVPGAGALAYNAISSGGRGKKTECLKPPWLQSEFQASLGNRVSPCLTTLKKKEGKCFAGIYERK